MGGCVSCTSAQVPEPIEENIFDILPRDPDAPDDLFKPLDVHFARNHTIANLLALYPSRRLPAEMVACIWRHYFECFLAPAPSVPPSLPSLAPTALPSGGSSSGGGANPWRHSPLGPASAQAPLSPSLSVSSAMPPVIGGGSGDDLPASTRAHGSFLVAGGGSSNGGNSARALIEHSSFGHSSTTTPKNSDAQHQIGGGVAKAAAPGATANGEEDRIEIACMQRLLTDILRHDLACLKERYDEVLAASLVMPPEEEDAAAAWGGGRRRPAEPAAANGGPNAAGPISFATFDPAPVLRALRGDLQRLNNMPIDYLARVALREMKGGSEEDLAVGGGASPDARKGSLSLQRQHSTLLNAPNSAAAAGVSPGAELSPLDRPALPAVSSVRSPSSRAWVGASSDAVATPASVAGTGLASSRSPLLLPSPSSFGTGARSPSTAAAAPLPPLSFDIFASAVDFTLRNLLDRCYRKGWWILFSLNLVHNARKVYAAARCPGAGGVGGGGVSGRLQPRCSRGGGSSGTWGDRIGAAAAVVALDAERASAVKLRKSSLSASVHTPVRPLSGQGGGPSSPGVGPDSSRAGTPSQAQAQAHAQSQSPPPVLPALRAYRSSLSRNGGAGGSLLPPPLPSGSSSGSAPPSPGAAVASFKLPPLLVIRNDNTQPGPAPLTALSADSLSPSSSQSSASFAFGTLAGGGGGGGVSLHSPGQSPPQSGTAVGAPPAGFGALFPSPSSNGRNPLRQQPPDEQTPSLAAIQEIV